MIFDGMEFIYGTHSHRHPPHRWCGGRGCRWLWIRSLRSHSIADSNASQRHTIKWQFECHYVSFEENEPVNELPPSTAPCHRSSMKQTINIMLNTFVIQISVPIKCKLLNAKWFQFHFLVIIIIQRHRFVHHPHLPHLLVRVWQCRQVRRIAICGAACLFVVQIWYDWGSQI